MQISNNLVSFDFSEKTGKMQITNLLQNEIVIKDAIFDIEGVLSLKSFDDCEKYFNHANKPKEVEYYNFTKRQNVIYAKWNEENKNESFEIKTKVVNDIFGNGEMMIIKYKFKNLFIITLNVSIYDEKPFVTFDTVIENISDLPVKIKEFHPLAFGTIYDNCKDCTDLRTLDGLSGNGFTHVKDSGFIQSSNNILLTFNNNNVRKTLVAGGLSYTDFAKYICLDDKKAVEQKGTEQMPTEVSTNTFGKLDMMAYDPSGRTLQPKEIYAPKDKFYIDCSTQNPFDALELYAKCVQKIQKADVNTYQFPILNGWYLSRPHYGDGVEVNHTKGLLNEAEKAYKSGITKYTKVAVQLEPDKYLGNTEQGWWDEEHWREFGHISDTEKSLLDWSEKLKEYNALPVIYFQSGMPSDDFAQKHPDFMVHDDVSLLYKPHVHELPKVTFDYTNEEFQKHMQNVWQHLKNAGVKGVKFDYPETAWVENGGFDDAKATTTSAYINLFKLAKNGLGEDSFVNERNLGAHEIPVVDVTAGVVDTQRIWTDSSDFDPYMITKAGLRWYKNRVLFNYDIEAKTFFKIDPKTNEKSKLNVQLCQSIITMSYVASCRLLMANSFDKLSRECVHAISRMYPIHEEKRMFKPIDAFTSLDNPCVYDYKINDEWHQLVLFNPKDENADISCKLSSTSEDIEQLYLDENAQYYAYDFWHDGLLGVFKGTDELSLNIKPKESVMCSIHKKQDVPQIISTTRHIMQGYVDLHDVVTTQNSISGKADVIGSEPFVMIIAQNGKPLKYVSCDNAKIMIDEKDSANDLCQVVIECTDTKVVSWKINF